MKTCPPSPCRPGRGFAAAARLISRCCLAASVGCASAAWAATCPPLCVTPNGVKNAAGIDPKLFAAIAFSRGDASVTASAATLEQIAREWKAAGGKGVLRLLVQGDAGLHAAESTRLAAARAASLTKALVGAGIPAANLQIAGR